MVTGMTAMLRMRMFCVADGCHEEGVDVACRHLTHTPSLSPVLLVRTYRTHRTYRTYRTYSTRTEQEGAYYFVSVSASTSARQHDMRRKTCGPISFGYFRYLIIE